MNKLGVICQFIGGGTPSKNVSSYWTGKIPWASIKDIKGQYLFSTIDSISEEGVENSATNVADINDLVLATRITPGRPIITKIKTAINQDLKIVKTKKPIDKLFLYYTFLNIEREILKKSNGTTVLGITLTVLNEIEIWTPTLPVQQAIVAKIEELFSELDNAQEQLHTAQKQLKVYRQSLLKWAFENPRIKADTIENVTEKIQIGPFGTQLHKEDYIENGIPLINPTHIQNGKIKANLSFTISEIKKKSLPNYILQEGDVIMGRRGEMGRCGLVTSNEDGWFCGTGSLYFRPNQSKLNSLFLYYFLNSQPVKKYLEENAGGTTMANLNLKTVNEIPIKIPSLQKQYLIVDELESKLTICDKMEETISHSLAQVDVMRQSILKKAFEGKLD